MKKFFNVPLADFFYKNVNTRQTIFKNALWLALAQGLTGVIKFFLAVLVIREFGATEYGKFAFAFSFVSIFSSLFDFGLFAATTRELARNKAKERIFPSLLALRLCLGCLIVPIIFIASLFVTPDKLTQKIMLVMGFFIFTTELLNFFFALFRARQNMEVEATFRIANTFILAGAVLATLYLAPSILNLSFAYVGSNLVTLIIVFASLLFRDNKGFSFRPLFNLPVWKEFILVGAYLALARGVGDVTMYTDSVMLGYWNQITETGWYNAAIKVNGLILFPMAVISAAVFPALVSALSESREKFTKLWKLWNKVTVFLAVMLSSVVYVNADKIIEALYTPAFQPTGAALKILVFMAAIVYVHGMFYHVLLIFDKQKKIFFVVLIGAVVNVVLNLILIPKFSLYGAAIATVVTHLVILLQYGRLIPKETFIKPFNSEFLFILAISLISVVVMYMASSFLKYHIDNLFLSLLFGVVVFSFSFMVFHKIGVQSHILNP